MRFCGFQNGLTDQLLECEYEDFLINANISSRFFQMSEVILSPDKKVFYFIIRKII